VSPTFRINAERLAVLAWPRAILLQIAHPLVAQGVADHSSFSEGRLSAFRRLHDTVAAMRAIAFGDRDRREAVLEGIRRVHDRVHGALPAVAGPYPQGTRYTAHDPTLLLWVHVTLLESIVVLHDRLVEPLDAAARDEYCASAAPVAVALGASPEDVPTTWLGLTRAMAAEQASGRIIVAETAQALGRVVLWPPMAWLAWPSTSISRHITIGLLPPALREAYGFPWTAAQARRHQRTLDWIAAARRWTPRSIAWWPEAREAQRAMHQTKTKTA
jgi:uncharacterized protein (DUF2236 family)